MRLNRQQKVQAIYKEADRRKDNKLTLAYLMAMTNDKNISILYNDYVINKTYY